VYVSLGSALIAALGMCSVPLLGVHGAESALALGVLLPPLCAYTSAALTQRAIDRLPVSLAVLFRRALGFAGLLWLLPVSVLWIDSLRVRNCSPLEGLAFMLLGPGFSVALASLTGILTALLTARRAPLWAAALPLLTMLLAISRFYTGPGIFAYGHFFGFFPGTLYDESVQLTGPFMWLRVETSLWIVALALYIVSCIDPTSLTLGLRPRPGFSLAFGCAVAAAAFALLAELNSDELGQSTSYAHVRTTLGGERKSARCRIFFPREYAERDRRRLADDCDFRVQQAENWLGVPHPAPVDAYLFRSPAEKYGLIGAEATNIAKPWHSEVYISEGGWPNPALGHEVVHVVAAGVGRGPLRISGSLAGLWPNPALVEGVATAAAWQPQGGLTPHEWAHAMLELGMVPPLSELFGASFLGQQRRLAYTLSGSLLRFVRERWGDAAIRETYSAGSLERGVGKPIAEIEAAWRKYLKSQPLAASALALARARFSGGGILSAVCPHTLAKLRDELRADVNAGDDPSAKRTCDRILALDNQDSSTRASLAALLARMGKIQDAQRELELLTKSGAPAPYLAAVKQSLADRALREGHSKDALALYSELLEQPLEDDQKRLLQVKRLGAEAAAQGGDAQADGHKQSALLFDLLVGAPGEHADGAVAVYLARELRSVRSDGLAQYLEARQLFFQARFGFASALLREARERGLPTPELSAEALRVEAVSRVALGELETATELFTRYAQTGSAARAAEADDFIARIRFIQKH
jgi:tetratricopeptide (TPR) repeat protein